MAIEVGNVFEGRVTGVKPFGAFVALPEGRVGMVHISEVSNEYVQDINTVLHDGDAVKVQVINIAPDGKIALSIKRLLPPAPRQPRGRTRLLQLRRTQRAHLCGCDRQLTARQVKSFGKQGVLSFGN